jgi:hypothetical protein
VAKEIRIQSRSGFFSQTGALLFGFGLGVLILSYFAGEQLYDYQDTLPMERRILTLFLRRQPRLQAVFSMKDDSTIRIAREIETTILPILALV